MAAPVPAPTGAVRAVLRPSGALPPGALPVRGYDFRGGPDHAELLRSFLTTGFQATSFAQAAAEINRMIDAKLQPLTQEEQARAALGGLRPTTGCTIFLGFTSNIISSGVRESIRYLLQHNMVHGGTWGSLWGVGCVGCVGYMGYGVWGVGYGVYGIWGVGYGVCGVCGVYGI
uniref:Uncharacterized protein n=1 Tax=Melopsittacus undulatus TaxID=13146 RepID=A0A8V5GX93_MELUD